MTLTIQLDDRTGTRLLELSKKEHKRPEAVAADAVRRSLFLDWFASANEKFSERAAKRGFRNEDDLLNSIS